MKKMLFNNNNIENENFDSHNESSLLLSEMPHWLFKGSLLLTLMFIGLIISLVNILTYPEVLQLNCKLENYNEKKLFLSSTLSHGMESSIKSGESVKIIYFDSLERKNNFISGYIENYWIEKGDIYFQILTEEQISINDRQLIMNILKGENKFVSRFTFFR